MAKASKKTVEAGAEAAPSAINLSVNKYGRVLFGDADNVRFRVENDTILIRPSTRTKGLGNLPKTDTMIPLSRSETMLKFSIPVAGVATGTAYLIEEQKYGWLRLTVVDGSLGKETPIARVVVR